MTSLGNMFPDASAELDSRPQYDRDALRRDVETVFGPNEPAAVPPSRDAISAASIAEVFTRPVPVITGSPSFAPPPVAAPRAPSSGRRGPRVLRRVLVVGSAGVVVAMVAVATFAIVGIRSQNELEAAQQTLAAAMAELDEAQLTVDTRTEMVESHLSAGLADADAVDGALNALAGYVDEQARVTAADAVSTYRDALERLAPSAAPATTAGDVDTASASSVLAEAERVQTRASELTELADDLSAVRAEAADAASAFRAAVSAFGGTVPVTVDAELAAAPDADPAVRTAVSDAVAAIAAAQAAGGLGVAELQALPAAIDALRVDQARVDAQARQDVLRETRRYGSNGSNGGTTVPTPVETTEPSVEPTPGPEVPEPQPTPTTDPTATGGSGG